MEEIGKLSEKEFRVMIIKMIQDLGNIMEKIQEKINKDLEELKNKQSVMNNTITKMKNTQEGINSRSELVNIDLETMDIEAVVEGIVVKMIKRDTKKERERIKEQNTRTPTFNKWQYNGKEPLNIM